MIAYRLVKTQQPPQFQDVPKPSLWPDTQKQVGWFKRLGLLGFLFFLGKGLLWLAMLAAAWWLP